MPVLVKDFSREVFVKFSGGKMNEEDEDKIKVFIEMVGEVPTKKLEKELVKSIDDLKVVGRTKELNARLDGSKSVVEEGLKWIISRFELHVRSVIQETIYKKADDRSKISWSLAVVFVLSCAEL